MKEILLVVMVMVLSIGKADALPCSCSVDKYHFLSCEAGTILNFPDDILESCITINFEEVRGIALNDQPLSELQGQAFTAFPNLLEITMSYNKIAAVAQDAFYGLTKVRNIFLSDNNITHFSEGTFDDLVSLKGIDVRRNDYLDPTYETRAWHFCERAQNVINIKGSLEIYKNLQPSVTTKDYCNVVQTYPQVPYCSLDHDKVLDCSGQERLPELACHLQTLDFTTIMFEFPADKKAPYVENYYQGETNSFIMDFNLINGTKNYTKLMENLSLFHTKFNLSSLPTLTSKRTKEVIIKADTIFMTSPITIDYKLTIHARVVALNMSIGMSMSKEKFLNMNGETLEAWAFKEETVYIGRVLMRTRQFGLVEIVDQLPEDETPSAPGDICKPLFKNTTETYLDVTGWFDKTFINLNYVCARTVQSSGLNPRLAAQMANFSLNFAFRAEDIKDGETFMAAQKFKQIQRAGEHPDVHLVPRYSTETVSKLAEVMSDRMAQYRMNEIAQEEQLFIAMGRVQDMQIQFDIILQQQQMYFDMELTILDAIWAATDNSWDFSFDHRNSIEDTIMGAINASTEASFQMMEKEYKELYAKAQANVDHMEEVVAKYESQLGRLQEMAQASMSTMKSISKDLDKKIDTLDSEVESFEKAIHHYMEHQVVNVIFSIFKCLVDIFRGNFGGAIKDIAKIAKQIHEIVKQIKKIQKALDAMDFGDLDDISTNLPTDFKTALQSATDLTKEGPRFDEIKNMATYRMPSFQDITHGKVKVTGVMEACANVADTGHRYTEATAEFANIMLNVADTKDEIKVAKADVGRAIEDVERIQQMISDLNEHRDDYQNYMKDAQKKYEDEVNQMKEDYHDMSDELRAEYKAKITAKFNEYQEVFKQSRANYNDQMNRLLESITEKTFGLKRHSMNQRGMIMSLYVDFCDAYFYHSFSVCDTTQIPLMSDSFELLLEKLSDIKWNSITSLDKLPGVPINFGPVPITVEDQLDLYKYPISTLKNQSRLDVNLKDYDTHHNFDRFWRVRLNMMRIILLDENNNTIPSPGQDFGEEIQSFITFPTVFNDTFVNHDAYTFISQDFFCPADYVTIDGEVLFRSSCTVDQEFTDQNYKPSADGIFSIYLPNSDKIPSFADVARMKVEFAGSWIPYNAKMAEWIY